MSKRVSTEFDYSAIDIPLILFGEQLNRNVYSLPDEIKRHIYNFVPFEGQNIESMIEFAMDLARQGKGTEKDVIEFFTTTWEETPHDVTRYLNRFPEYMEYVPYANLIFTPNEEEYLDVNIHILPFISFFEYHPDVTEFNHEYLFGMISRMVSLETVILQGNDRLFEEVEFNPSLYLDARWDHLEYMFSHECLIAKEISYIVTRSPNIKSIDIDISGEDGNPINDLSFGDITSLEQFSLIADTIGSSVNNLVSKISRIRANDLALEMTIEEDKMADITSLTEYLRQQSSCESLSLNIQYVFGQTLNLTDPRQMLDAPPQLLSLEKLSLEFSLTVNMTIEHINAIYSWCISVIILSSASEIELRIHTYYTLPILPLIVALNKPHPVSKICLDIPSDDQDSLRQFLTEKGIEYTFL